MTLDEERIEAWISLTQNGQDELCTQLREVASSTDPLHIRRQKLVSLLLLEQLRMARGTEQLLRMINAI